MALPFSSMSDGFDAEDAPSALAELTGYELWEHTQRSGEQVAAACERMIAAPSTRARVALAPEFLRRVRWLATPRPAAGPPPPPAGLARPRGPSRPPRARAPVVGGVLGGAGAPPPRTPPPPPRH